MGVAADPDLGGGAVGLAEGGDEVFFALEGADDGDAQFVFERGGEAGEEGVGEVDDVGAEIGFEVVEEAVDFFALAAFAAGEDGDGHGAESGGFDVEGEAGGPAEQAGVVEEAVEGRGEAAKEGGELLEVGVDAAEEDGGEGEVVVVGFEGGCRGGSCGRRGRL